MPNNDFRSLLSTFLDATTTPTPTPTPTLQTTTKTTAHVNHNNNNKSTKKNQSVVPNEQSSHQEKNNNNSNKTTTTTTTSGPSLSLFQATERLYQISQIRRATKTTTTTTTKKKKTLSSNRASSSEKKKVEEEDDEEKGKLSKEYFSLAVCICIVDSLPHWRLWRQWSEERNVSLSNSSSDSKPTIISASAQLFIHAKHPEKVQEEWVRSKLLSHSYQPNWNDVRIVRAMLSLTQEALNHDQSSTATTHILYCTESCIPITTLDVAVQTILQPKPTKNDIMKYDYSFVDAYGRDSERCTRFDERSCWDPLQNSITPNAIYKALPGWCLLSRKHAEQILNLPNKSYLQQDLWPAFEHVWAPEEIYFPTALALLGHIPSSSSSNEDENNDEVISMSLIYAQWNERALDHRDRAHPKIFDDCFNEEFVQYVRSKGCLFVRKMKRPLDLSLWNRIVVESSSSSSIPTDFSIAGDEGDDHDHDDDDHDGSKMQNQRDSSFNDQTTWTSSSSSSHRYHQPHESWRNGKRRYDDDDDDTYSSQHPYHDHHSNNKRNRW